MGERRTNTCLSIIETQKQLKKRSLKILEINPNHELVKKANDLLKHTDNTQEGEQKREEGKEMVLMINDIAGIAQGDKLDNSGVAVKRILKYIKV